MDRLMVNAHPYKYPSVVRQRRHAPRGYKNYKKYQPWLEDEFSFRCAYCLKRMQWAPTDIWTVDHLKPQSLVPQNASQYENLVLACQWCNRRKFNSSLVPDPLATAYGNLLRVDNATGEVEAMNEAGDVLIRELQLNHPAQIRARRRMLEALVFARADFNEWKKWMGFPEKLPNLGTEKPPMGNDRPEGILASCHERRQRGELPDWYDE